ncbi:collectin-12-like [Mauremys mutica]|uniref:collectin-12-like n=1 Tax=Mauremys mutica TaxID=74926 RepID=UPI001D16237C|nr:collectin-12-like [Mauremys mutica]
MGRAGVGAAAQVPPDGTGQTRQLLLQEQRRLPGPAGWRVSCGPCSLELVAGLCRCWNQAMAPGCGRSEPHPDPRGAPGRGDRVPAWSPSPAEPSPFPGPGPGPASPPGYEGRSPSCGGEFRGPGLVWRCLRAPASPELGSAKTLEPALDPRERLLQLVSRELQAA